ncbi:MAG: hypothetical protein U0223_13260 [Nitrospira sp.]|nr:hypothetical protein [Nitrospira sp.]
MMPGRPLTLSHMIHDRSAIQTPDHCRAMKRAGQRISRSVVHDVSECGYGMRFTLCEQRATNIVGGAYRRVP